MNLARLAGLDVAEVYCLSIAELEALLVTRFDRAIDEQSRIIRIHQEDFAQALGLSAELKYERRGELGKRFDTRAIRSILDRTSNPDLARNSFIASTFFDLLVGNSDAHAKNHAVIYNNGPIPKLAPRYDIVPTRLDPQVTGDFPFRIGTALNISGLQQSDLSSFLSTLGIVSRGAQRRLNANVFLPMTDVLINLLSNLQQDRQKSFADLIAANIKCLFPILNEKVPEAVSRRDAFITTGGGWLSN